VFQKRLGDSAFIARMSDELIAATELNTKMQAFFQPWHAVSDGRNRKIMLDQRDLAWFADMNGTLHDVMDDDTLAARLRDTVRMMRLLAASIVERAADDHPSLREVAGDLVDVEGERTELFARVA
jgi:hypothetical protein